MKKIFALVLTVVLLMSSFVMVSEAKVGDVVGSALHTDIVVYINNFAIPSYAVNGQSVVVAEDLRNFGFDVVWNEYARSLTISRNSSDVINPMHVDKTYNTGDYFTSILATDITVWAEGKRLTSYAMNGYTMIPAEELTMFGLVSWNSAERALEIWIENLDMLNEKQMPSKHYYSGTYAPDFGWVTQSPCFSCDDTAYGDINRYYYSDPTKTQQYINYITSRGWYLQGSVQDSEGVWYSGYMNDNLRTGIAIAGYNDLTFVQVNTEMDYWTFSGIR